MDWKCKENCSACCGCIPIDKTLAKLFESKAQKKVIEVIQFNEFEIIPFTEDGKCVFLKKDNRCAIYNYRPEVCRKYGTVKELPCPYIDIHGNERKPNQVKRMQNKINKQMDQSLRQLELISKRRI